MGDVTTHAEIMAFVMSEARRTIADRDIPEADYTYLELGNFLTDVSQFRDPPSFHRGREVARARARQVSSLAPLFGADEWASELFGRRTGRRHGVLPEMLGLLAQAFTHELFDDDALPLLGAALNLVTPGARPVLIPEHGIPPAEVTRILRGHYTQYFPHEHLDFPPTVDAMPRHRTGSGSLYRRESRGLVRYLEWFIHYLSESLTQLEEEWVRTRAGRMTHQQRQEFLVRLGHLLHPVEDYFFHSNLLELYQWGEVRALHPQADPVVPDGLRRLVDDGLVGTRLSRTSVDLRRKLHRRLRYPVWMSNTQLSTTASEDATDVVFTGGFGETDMAHTLGNALEHIETKLSVLPSSHDPRRSPLVLVRLLLSQAERADMVRRNTVEAMQARHLAQLRAGDYPRAIARWETNGLICPHAGDLLRQAFALDLATSNRHVGRVASFPGPGAVLIMLLGDWQTERQNAAAAARRLDGSSASMYAVSSDNGCSEERVGTHSLMSKDSADKEPMRPEAVAFAKHASAGITTVLLNRVHSATPVAEGVDWDTMLRFFLRGPAQVSGTWETELLAQLRATGGFRQPPVTSLGQQPQLSLLGPSFGAAKLADRRVGHTRRDLEAYYGRFESDP